MKRWSIHARLTLWYGASLAVALALLASGVWWVLQSSLYRDIDQRLEDHATETGRIVGKEIGEHDRAEAIREIQESLSASPGELSAVCDARGAILYRAPGLGNPCEQSAKGFGNLAIRDVHFRAYLSQEGPYRIYVATSTQHITGTLDRLRWILLLSAPVALLIAMAGGYWLSLRAMAPIEEIARTARTIGLENLSRRLPVPETADALQRLAETLNGMFARLESSFQRISQFTADAAHELRTPLALIRTTAEVALRSNQPGEYQAALSQIVEETERMTKLVENLLDLARADSGAPLPVTASVPLGDVLRDVLQVAAKLAAAADIRFLVPEEIQPWRVQGDPASLRRLLLILIDNAIKYTPPGGQVTIAVFDSQIAITDTGIGISPADMAHIFDRFYRADKARSRDSGGSGLGLSIAQWLAKAHGAAITVESELGRGSTFAIRF